MLCGLCLVGGFAACQKVDLPSGRGGEDTEQPGQTGDKPGNEGHEPGGQTNRKKRFLCRLSMRVLGR